MTIIRLQRLGKKGQAQFRLVVQDKAKDTHDRSLEILGFLNPHTDEVQIKEDRVKYWISQGAQLSDTVHNLLVDKKIIDLPKVKSAKIKKVEAPAETPVATVEKPAVPAAEETKTPEATTAPEAPAPAAPAEAPAAETAAPEAA